MALKYCSMSVDLRDVAVTRAKTLAGVMGRWFADFQRASVSQILKRIVWRLFDVTNVHQQFIQKVSNEQITDLFINNSPFYLF